LSVQDLLKLVLPVVGMTSVTQVCKLNSTGSVFEK